MSNCHYVHVHVACSIIKSVVMRSRSDLDLIQAPVNYSLLNSYLCAPVSSPCHVPAYPTSIMDGYCLHLSEHDTNHIYQVIGRVRAGPGQQHLHVDAGQAVYVTTGSVLPPGADTVVPIEWIQSLPHDYIQIDRQITSGMYIRQIGQDIRQGQEILSANKKIEAPDLALLISLGIEYVHIYRHIRIGVCSTGDEILDIMQPISDRGHVRDSNRPLLIAYLQQLNEPIEIIDLGIIRDQLEGSESSITETLGKAAQDLDIIISTGGISMGSHDLIKEYLNTKAQVHFHQVNMKPGKPTIFAQLGRCLIFALPGNPLSAACNFHLFVKPAVRLLSNQLSFDGDLHTNVMCTIQGTYPCDPVRPVYQFAWVYWDQDSNRLCAIPTIQSTHCSGSSRLLTAQQANGIIHSPVQNEPVQHGQLLPVTLIGSLDHFISPPIQKDIPETIHHCHQHRPATAQHSASGNHFKKDFVGNLRCCLLVCSDRAFRGEYADESGPCAAKFLSEHGIEVLETVIVPDEWDRIREQILTWTDDTRLRCDLVFTIGGTGLSNRDITPDVTSSLLDRSIPTLVWAMVADGRKYTPYALLSRAQAGVRRKSLIINLVGSVKGCVQNLNSIVQVLPHAISLLRQS